MTRVQLASHPDIILLLDGNEARGHPSDVVQRVRHRLYAAGSDPSEGLS
ncbi:MAG TPA: hypothetical protein VHT52_23140 [Stellaceae bacterium]|nr:hypothetical protein [Stellaceae bacterium]